MFTLKKMQDLFMAMEELAEPDLVLLLNKREHNELVFNLYIYIYQYLIKAVRFGGIEASKLELEV